MLAIEQMAYALPEKNLRISEHYAEIGISQSEAKVYHRLYGLDYLPVQENGSLLALMIEAVGAVLSGVDKCNIKYIIHAHTGALIAPFSQSKVRELKYHFGLNHAAAFATSFNKCTSLLFVFEWVEQLLKAESASAKALLVTGDLGFHRDLRVMKSTSLTGDAASSAIVSRTGTANQVMAFKHRMQGQFAAGIWLAPEKIIEQETQTPETLVDVILQLLAEKNIKLAEIRCIIPHNINTLSWLKIAKILGISTEKIYLKGVARTAHCFCSDMLMNYMHAKAEGYFTSGDCVLMAAIGVGSVFAVSLIRV